MFNHYLVTALRHFRRYKSSTAINVLGLAFGLACFVAVLGALAYLRSSAYEFPHVDRIHVIAERVRMKTAQWQMDTGYSLVSSAEVAKYVRADFPAAETAAFATRLEALAMHAGDRTVLSNIAVVEPEFLRIFQLPVIKAIAGDPLPAGRNAVIAAALAKRLFGSTDVLGRSIILRDALDVSITGVIDDIDGASYVGTTSDSRFDFELLISTDTALELSIASGQTTLKPQPNGFEWAHQRGLTYLLAAKGKTVDSDVLNQRLQNFAGAHLPPADQAQIELKAIPIASGWLASLDSEFFKTGGWSVSASLLSLGFVVLAIAGINYANLTLAQSLGRSRELGVRRALGATRWHIGMQSWMEASLQTLAAAIVAIALLLPMIIFVVGKKPAYSMLIAVTADTTFWCAAIGVLILLPAVLALYPVLRVTGGIGAQSPRELAMPPAALFGTRWLIGLQFGAASLFLIALSILYLQDDLLRRASLRPQEDPVVVLRTGMDAAHVSFATLRDELLHEPSIRAVSAVEAPPWVKAGQMGNLWRKAQGTQFFPLASMVGFDFDQVLGLHVIAGRSFDREHADDVYPAAIEPGAVERTYSLVIDRRFAAELGWADPTQAIGELLYQPSEAGPLALRIIGVVDRSLRLEALNGSRSNVYFLRPSLATHAVIRIARDRIPQALQRIDDTWKSLAPRAPLRRKFADDYFEDAYRNYQIASQVIVGATCLAAVVAALGLFSMAFFVASRRTREIGVRKTLGARATQIVVMLLAEFSLPVLIANVLIWPLGFIAAHRYLDLFVDRVELTPLPFMGSLFVVLVVAWIAVGGHAWRAANVRPSVALRGE